jgi:predicted transcriptional regulator
VSNEAQIKRLTDDFIGPADLSNLPDVSLEGVVFESPDVDPAVDEKRARVEAMRSLVEDVAGQSLQGDPNTKYNLSREKPKHRMVILLSAAGYSNKQIAAELGITPVWVGHILRQPWAVEMLGRLVASGTSHLVQNKFASIVPSAIEALAEITTNPEAPASARVSSATAILDRFLGKPTQRVETKSEVTYRDADEEKRQLERELANLQSRSKARTGMDLETLGLNN